MGYSEPTGKSIRTSRSKCYQEDNLCWWINTGPCILSRKWQSAPAFLPGKPHRQRNLAGYSPLNTRYMLRYNWQKLIKPSLVPGIIKNRTDWLVIIKVTKQHKIGKNTECKIKLPRGPMVSQSVIHQEQAMNTDLAGNVSFMRIQKCWIKNF